MQNCDKDVLTLKSSQFYPH